MSPNERRDLLKDLYLGTIIAVMLAGLFTPAVDNNEIFGLLTLIVGYLLGKKDVG